MIGDLPLTFEARSAIAHFDKRALKLARLRTGKSGQPKDLEVVVPGAGGSKGQLVVPLDKLPEFSQLDARDMALHGAIKDAVATKPAEPFLMRKIRIDVDSRHALTDEARAAAQPEAKADEIDRFQVRISFIALLTRECGICLGD
ncbi:MAG: hypothetical protein FJX52_06320 [Alphaproteobacteria bacterium]|nr:hypothetical protein [Alphaproteobacteria bacterium]